MRYDNLRLLETIRNFSHSNLCCIRRYYSFMYSALQYSVSEIGGTTLLLILNFAKESDSGSDLAHHTTLKFQNKLLP